MLGAMLLQVACSNDHVYECSADVHPSGWTPADTLYFPIRVEQAETPYAPIAIHFPYCLNLIVRYEKSYPAPVIPVHIQLDKEYVAQLDLGDEASLPDGDSWGSLFVKEFEITRKLFSFPDSGDYVLKVWPDERVDDIVSVSVVLE